MWATAPSALQRFLREREAAIALLGLDLKHRTHPLTRLRIGLALPSGEAVHLRGLLAERLAALVLPGPVIALRLRSGALLPAMPANGWLWKQAHAQETMDALPRLIERLRARLGNERVFGVCAVADHRPECAWKVGAGNEIHDLPRVDRPRRAAERPFVATGTATRDRAPGKKIAWPGTHRNRLVGRPRK